jgi:hypothetical protein
LEDKLKMVDVSQISSEEYREMTHEISDNEWSLHTWVLSSGMTQNTYDELQDAGRRIKFTDTSIGGSLYINRRPQASLWSDLNEPRLMIFDPSDGYREKSFDVSFGMGRWFSEQVDDMQSLIHLRAGTVSFSSMFGYMLRAYDPVLDMASRDSMINETMFKFGQFVGFITGFSLPIQGALFLFKTIDAVMISGCSSEYATCKPNMVITWRRAQTIFDSMLTAIGWRPDLSTVDGQKENQMSKDAIGKMDDKALAAYNELMSDIFTNKSGAFDLRAMVTRPMRAMFHIRDYSFKAYESALKESNEGIYQDIEAMSREVAKKQIDLLRNPTELSRRIRESEVDSLKAWEKMYGNTFYKTSDTKKGSDFVSLMDKYGKEDVGVENKDLGNNASNPNANYDPLTHLTKDSVYGMESLTHTSAGRIAEDHNVKEEVRTSVRKALSDWEDYQRAEWNDGSAFITFAATGNTTATDSFSNSSKEPMIKGFMSSMGARFRDLNNSTSGMNVIPGMGELIGGVTGFIKGQLDGIGLGGLAGILSQATPVFPELPESSSCQLQTITLTMECRSPYGTRLSRVSNQLIPLAIVLALATPYSSGYQSYGSPPVIEYYQRGFAHSRFAMVNSVAVTRGVGNKGWDRDGGSLGMTIHMELVPLTKDVHFPIVSSAMNFRGPSALSTYLSRALYDSDNLAKDYIAAVCAVDPQTQIYTMNKIRRNWQNAKQNFMDSFTKASINQSIWDLPVLNIAKGVSKGNYLLK